MITRGTPPIAGVVGWPVSHSLSPRLHGYWLRENKIDGQYLPLAVQPVDLEATLHALPRLGYRGVNITVPHKEHALQMCDELDEISRQVGAINMVTVTKEGMLVGRNTDGIGFIENLRGGSKWDPTDGPVVVLGAGGAARAVIAALNYAEVSEIRICNRKFSRAESLASTFGTSCVAIDWSNRDASLEDAALLVNTTSLGMKGQPPLEIKLDALSPRAVVNDIVYVPIETPLLEAARARGNWTGDGLGMLLHQARPAFEEWFGKLPDISIGLREYVLEK